MSKDSKDRDARGKKAKAEDPRGKPYLAKVYVALKPTVNDPEGNTIAGALGSLGFEGVESVRSGKYFQVRLRAKDVKKAARAVDTMAARLLANPVIEAYTFEVAEV
jgi:phosphoribosylformylglycinamidine synthase